MDSGALVAKVALRDCGFKELSHPPYSLNLDLFSNLTGHSHGKHFGNDTEH